MFCGQALCVCLIDCLWCFSPYFWTKNSVKFKKWANNFNQLKFLLTKKITQVKYASLTGQSPLYNATLAQLVERNLAKVEVTSSNLVCRSKF